LKSSGRTYEEVVQESAAVTVEWVAALEIPT